MTASNYRERAASDCRLIMLRALADEPDYSLGETMLSVHLESFGHNKTQEFVREQIRWLEEAGAVSVSQINGYLIAEIKQRGKDHIEGRTVIDGVHRPSPKA